MDLEEGGAVEAEEVFPLYQDASMEGWPLVVRWAQNPPVDPSAEPSAASED